MNNNDDDDDDDDDDDYDEVKKIGKLSSEILSGVLISPRISMGFIPVPYLYHGGIVALCHSV